MELLKKIKTNYSDLSRTHILYDCPYELTVMYEGVPFEFLLNMRSQKRKVIVFGSGAYQMEKIAPPIFQRHSWIHHIEESSIFYNDPTLYLGKMSIGWGFGNEDKHYLEIISNILVKIFDYSNILRNNVMFHGSSGGGFMSLLLGGFIKETKVMVNNPQTVVTNYYKSHVNALFETLPSSHLIDDIMCKYKTRLNASYFYNEINYIPEIIYLQNVASQHDMKYHLSPFLSELHFMSDFFSKINIVLYCDKEKGHSPLGLNETLVYFRDYFTEL